MQCKTLEDKIQIALNNIFEWYEYWGGKVYIAFSGGKDSTVLLHLARSLYPDIQAVFDNTGLEYPEILTFVKKTRDVEWVRPKIPFHKVLERSGYPIISKTVSQKVYEIRHTKSMYARNRKLSGKIGLSLPKKYRYLIEAPFLISDKCCYFLKKEPLKRFEKKSGKKPMIALMATDSRARKLSQKRFGCNAFEKKEPESRPIMAWNTDDVWQYIRVKNISYASIYDKNVKNTGCMFCGFGVQFDGEPNRYEQMKASHPKHYDYVINRLGFGQVLDFIGISY